MTLLCEQSLYTFTDLLPTLCPRGFHCIQQDTLSLKQVFPVWSKGGFCRWIPVLI